MEGPPDELEAGVGHSDIAEFEGSSNDGAEQQDHPANSSNEATGAAAGFDITSAIHEDADPVREEAQTAADEERLEEDEYDPPLNPDWRASFRKRETIFDIRPRRSRVPRAIRDAIAQDSRVRDGWKEQWILHNSIDKGNQQYVGHRRRNAFAERCMDFALDKYIWWQNVVERWEEKLRDWEEEWEKRVWEEELPFWNGGDGFLAEDELRSDGGMGADRCAEGDSAESDESDESAESAESDESVEGA